MSTDSSLSKWEDQLKNMLDMDVLIIELYSKGVLGDELYRKLLDEKDRWSEIDQILHLANERQCEFCEALNETHQGHITNYIRRKGVRPGDDDDGNWPLYGTSQWDKLRKNLLKLIELTDSYHGLVDEMVEADCITDQQAENIYNLKEHAARNRKLFDTLKLRSITAYHRFIDCLLKTNQPHVASLLEPAKGGEVQPLSPEYRRRLRSNYATLSKLIDVKTGGLLALMYQEKCLDRRQMEAIQANATSATDSARLLLDILLRSSQPTFDCFMRCLEKDRQKHLHKLLLGNVTCAQIDASLSGTENNKETEELTVEKIISQWLCLPRDEQKRAIRELSDLWSSNDVELLTAEVGHSIRLYFLCGSLAGVQFLRKVYDNGDLCSIVQRLFRSLLEDSVNIVVDNLNWEKSNFESCLHYFVPAISEQFLSADTTKSWTVGGIAKSDDIADDVTQGPSKSGQVDFGKTRLQSLSPSEGVDDDEDDRSMAFETKRDVTENPADKSHLYDAENETARNLNVADESHDAAAQIQSVSSEDYSSILSMSTTSSDEMVARIVASKDRKGHVKGLTILDNELFIVHHEPKSLIEVYNATNLTFKRSMKVKELETGEVNGLTSCGSNNCLYVSHWYIDSIGYIIRVELTGDNKVGRWKVKDGSYKPEGLSVNSEYNLLVACRGRRPPHRLLEYTTRGDLVREIRLRDDVVNPRHAIQLNNIQFLVSHCGERVGSLHRVCVVDVNGQVLSSYGNKHGSETGQLNRPQHLAVTRSGTILVADCDNSRIVLLDGTLKRPRDLQIGGGVRVQQPYSLCLDEQRLMLFVGEQNGDESRVVVVERPQSNKPVVHRPH